jgi:hypothetical protein
MNPPAQDEPHSMAVALRQDGRIAFIFEDFEQSFTDDEAMDIAKAIALCLRHKQSQARDAA